MKKWERPKHFEENRKISRKILTSLKFWKKLEAIILGNFNKTLEIFQQKFYGKKNYKILKGLWGNDKENCKVIQHNF